MIQSMLDLPLHIAAQFLALGAAGGFLAGLLGIGGGMVLVPFITLLLGQVGVPSAVAMKMGVATAGAAIVFTSLSSLRAHHGHGAVRWPLVLQFTPGLVLGGLFGGVVGMAALGGRGLALLFAVFNAVMAWRMWRQPASGSQRPLPGPWGVGAMGVLIGVISSLVAAGGAFLSVPFMTRHSVPLREAVGTSAALGFPIALSATAGYVVAGWKQAALLPGTWGYIHLPGLLCVALCSVALAPVGAWCSQRLPVAQLRRTFSLMLLSLGLYVAWKVLGDG